MSKKIEIILASPPERDELVAQLFHVNGGQWGEIFRHKGVYVFEVWPDASGTLKVDCEECLVAMQRALNELKSRFE